MRPAQRAEQELVAGAGLDRAVAGAALGGDDRRAGRARAVAARDRRGTARVMRGPAGSARCSGTLTEPQRARSSFAHFGSSAACGRGRRDQDRGEQDEDEPHAHEVRDPTGDRRRLQDPRPASGNRTVCACGCHNARSRALNQASRAQERWPRVSAPPVAGDEAGQQLAQLPDGGVAEPVAQLVPRSRRTPVARERGSARRPGSGATGSAGGRRVAPRSSVPGATMASASRLAAAPADPERPASRVTVGRSAARLRSTSRTTVARRAAGRGDRRAEPAARQRLAAVMRIARSGSVTAPTAARTSCRRGRAAAARTARRAR